jgi:hypothetical protein
MWFLWADWNIMIGKPVISLAENRFLSSPEPSPVSDALRSGALNFLGLCGVESPCDGSWRPRP